MATNPLKALAFSAVATAALVLSDSSGAMATIAAGPQAGDQAAIIKTAAAVVPVSRHYGRHRWRGGYRGRGYYVAPYWGYSPGYYYGYPVFGGPYFYYGGPPYDNYSPPVENPPVASGRCSYWHQQCVKNWGSNNPNYYGCMRYEKCAP